MSTSTSSLPPGAPGEHAASAAIDATTAIAWPDAARARAFDGWLAQLAPAHGLRADSLRAASADASFRRYFRVDGVSGIAGSAVSPATSFIVMDAPPPQEDVRPFVHLAGLIGAAGLHAPRVLAAQPEQGFVLMTDLGSRLMLTELQSAVAAGDSRTVEALMRSAATLLVAWQSRLDASALPPFDAALLQRELALFPEWCVAREFGVQWTDAQQAQWAATCTLLTASALAQPTVAVHRDYMPRNLMVGAPPGLGDNAAASPATAAAAPPTLGLLDFQDAVRGPISYDLASLLRDAFISWDEEQELDWAIRYWQQARKHSLPVGDDFGEFWRQVEWMGLQRHLKVLGIFCRLKHRDGKPGYSADLPRFFAYAHKVALRYQGLGPLARLLEPLMGATRTDAFY